MDVCFVSIRNTQFKTTPQSQENVFFLDFNIPKYAASDG